MKLDPEYITIVEGPTPEFLPSADFSMNSILEGPIDAITALCEMRTMNGKDIIARCRQAWDDGRPVKLDFPDEMRMRQEVDVIGLRLKELEEGMLLQVWVSHPVDVFEEVDDEEFDEDDEGGFLF